MKSRPHLDAPRQRILSDEDRRLVSWAGLGVLLVFPAVMLVSSWKSDRDAASLLKSDRLRGAQMTLEDDVVRMKAAEGDYGSREAWLNALSTTGATDAEIREQQRHWESLDASKK